MVFISWTYWTWVKAMVNNSGLSQIKKNMNKATMDRVMEIKRGKYF